MISKSKRILPVIIKFDQYQILGEFVYLLLRVVKISDLKYKKVTF